MECKFSKNRYKNESTLKLDGQEISESKRFRYLGSIIYKDWEIEDDVNLRIRTR